MCYYACVNDDPNNEPTLPDDDGAAFDRDLDATPGWVLDAMYEKLTGRKVGEPIDLNDPEYIPMDVFFASIKSAGAVVPDRLTSRPCIPYASFHRDHRCRKSHHSTTQTRPRPPRAN
jgi:hypothetical protein